MTKIEFAKIAAAIRAYYPQANIIPNEAAAELWFRQLGDIPYQTATVALNKWVSVNRWPPTIADIREAALEVSTDAIPDWSEAWETVLNAIRRFGPYRQEDAMASLDEITLTVVRRLGFMNLCSSENIAADRANFRTIYQVVAERRRKEEQLPEALRAAIRSNRELIERIKAGEGLPAIRTLYKDGSIEIGLLKE